MNPYYYMDYTQSCELRVLHALIKKSPLSPCRSVIITHVLPTARKFIEEIHRAFPISLLIAIPYSSDQTTIDALKKAGFPIYLPLTAEETFQYAGPLVEDLLKKDPSPLLVQEVGGYLAGYTSHLSKYSHFLGVVEDTNNGHWRYVHAGPHAVPIVSIARSPIKDIEDTVIGDAVIYSLERVYREEFQSILQGVRSGVIGYGKIGTSTAIALKGRESSVSVYDIDPTKCIRAKFEGYRIEPLKKLLESSDLIVGCTGKTSVRKKDIPHIRHNSMLVSASSKHEEFDIDAFDEVCSFQDLSPIVRKYTQKNTHSFYLLNKGAPINFRDHSILGFILDMIYSELFLCMKLLSEKALPHGLHLSPASLSAEVGKTWLGTYTHEFAENREDNIWDFPESMHKGLTSTFHLQMKAKQSEEKILEQLLTHVTHVF